MCFLHQYSQGEEFVSIVPASTETTLASAKELSALGFSEGPFCSGLEPVQDGFNKHLAWYAERAIPR